MTKEEFNKLRIGAIVKPNFNLDEFLKQIYFEKKNFYTIIKEKKSFGFYVVTDNKYEWLIDLDYYHLFDLHCLYNLTDFI